MSEANLTFQPELEMARQRQALNYLRDQAREAHREGDGMLVQHLCAVAVRSLIDLAKAKSLRLTLREIYWAPVLQLYWLHREFSLIILRHEAWPHVIEREEETNELRRCLNALLWLVEQPLGGSVEPILSPLNGLEFAWIGDRDEIEATVLLTFIAELLWYRDTKGQTWGTLLPEWTLRVPEHIQPALRQTVERLKAQGEIASPDGTSQAVAQLGTNFTLEIQTLHRLWIAALQCDFAQVDELRKTLLPRLPVESWTESRVARILFDFHHATRGATASFGDPQELGLTRRQLLTAGAKGHTVPEARDAHFAEMINELLRAGPDGHKPSERFHCIRLAMLKELSALREWDYGDWREALEFQSLCNLEGARADAKLEVFASQGISLAVQARSFRGRKDPLTRSALNTLDQANPEIREGLVRQLLCMHPLQRYDALQAFDEISDAIPEPLLPEVADWYVRFVEQDSDKLEKARGSTAAPLAMWRHILGKVECTPELCRRLFPAFTKEAASRGTYFGEGPEVTLRFIRHASEEQARTILDTLAKQELPQDFPDFERWALIYNALLDRPKLRAEPYFELLRRTSHKPLRAHYLRRISEGYIKGPLPTDPKFTAWLRELLLKLNYESTSNDVSARWLDLVHWDIEEEPLVDHLTQLVDDPRCSCLIISSSMDCLTGMAAAADHSLLDKLVARAGRWLQAVPVGQNRNQTSPYNVMRSTEHDQSHIDESVAYLALTLTEAGSVSLLPSIQFFVERLSVAPSAAVAPFLTRLACEAALLPDAAADAVKLFNTARGVCQTAYMLAETDTHWMTACRRTFANMYVMLRDKFSPEGETKLNDPSVGKDFLRYLQALLPHAVTLSDPNARAEVAKLIVWFIQSGISDDRMKDALGVLRKDHRARVRHQTLLQPSFH